MPGFIPSRLGKGRQSQEGQGHDAFGVRNRQLAGAHDLVELVAYSNVTIKANDGVRTVSCNTPKCKVKQVFTGTANYGTRASGEYFLGGDVMSGRTTWVRANRGGILLADVTLGTTVRQGDLLGTITDPMNNASTNIYSPHSGRIIGMARNQVVMPGFAVFHVGIQTDEAVLEISDSAVDDDADADGLSE